MPSLSRLTELHVPIVVEFHGETIEGMVAPGRWNGALEDELSTSGDRQAGYLLVQRLLVSWDIVDDAGTPFPTDDASLRSLPSAVIAAVGEAIVDAVRPGKGQRGA